jgi:uracil-DNA glycosylase
MSALPNLRVVVCLGRIAFDGLLAWLQRSGNGPKIARSSYVFSHGAEFVFADGLRAISSYHPSLQNTNTGKLTVPMLLSVFNRARQIADGAPDKPSSPNTAASILKMRNRNGNR